VERTAADAARRKFAPEFMNRIDKIVVFHTLGAKQLEEILEIELEMVQRRVMETARDQFAFRVTVEARRFLLREGTDTRYGARHLKRAIEKHLVYPLASLLATEQIAFGDTLSVDHEPGAEGLAFVREGRSAPPSVLPPASGHPALSRSAGQGGAPTGSRGSGHRPGIHGHGLPDAGGR
jgi:ATP-dependent Clp protease ATP-binding subunit ClpA